jgi:hypothetical protein
MLAQQIEVVDGIAQVIGVGIELGAGIAEIWKAQGLRPFRPRLLRIITVRGRGPISESE